MKKNHFTSPPEGFKELVETVGNHGLRLEKLESAAGSTKPPQGVILPENTVRDILRMQEILLAAVSEIRRKEVPDRNKGPKPSKSTQIGYVKGDDEQG
jgi:hypothetical protein